MMKKTMIMCDFNHKLAKQLQLQITHLHLKKKKS